MIAIVTSQIIFLHCNHYCANSIFTSILRTLKQNFRCFCNCNNSTSAIAKKWSQCVKMYLGYIKTRIEQILLLEEFYFHIAKICLDVMSEVFCLCSSQKRDFCVIADALLLFDQKLCEFYFYTFFASNVVNLLPNLNLA